MHVTGQVAPIVTSPSTIASVVPGYTQFTTINVKTINFTPPTLPADLTLIDEDSTKEINIKLWYADVLTTNISNSDGNITSTSLGKVWTLKISVPQALNIRLNFSQFSLSTFAKMYYSAHTGKQKARGAQNYVKTVPRYNCGLPKDCQ